MTDEANNRSEELHEPRMEWQAERYSIATLRMSVALTRPEDRELFGLSVARSDP